jgi:hypothetical protein
MADSSLLHRLIGRLRPAPPPSFALERTRYIESRQPHAYAPHDAALYGALLRQLRAAGNIELPLFARRAPGGGRKARFYLRHDVDTADCVEKLPLLLDINIAEGVASPVYVRTDGTDYPPQTVAAAVAHYRAKGVEFGLHSACYTEDDYLGTFRRELERFADCFGFRARSFTMHGLGSFRAEIRERFSEEVVARLPEFGLTFTDCNPRLRQYDYVITDCHPEPGTGRRYICDDVIDLPRFFDAGRDHLVLTHPCYWR